MYAYVSLLVLWLMSVALRFAPPLRERFPDAQVVSLAIGWGALLAIILLVITGQPG